MEALKLNTINTKVISDLLTRANLDIETDMAGVEYEEDGFYLYAYIYFDGSAKDIGFTIDNEKIDLSDDQITGVYDYLLNKGEEER